MTKSFYFSLNLRGEPLFLSQCEPTLQTNARSYQDVLQYLDGQAPLIRGRLQIKREAPDFSLMPRPSYSVNVGGLQPASFDSRQYRRVVEPTHKIARYSFSADDYRKEIKRRDPLVNQIIPGSASPRKTFPSWHCYGQNDCIKKSEDTSFSKQAQALHLDGIPLWDALVEDVGDFAKPFSLYLNRAASTRKFALSLRSISGLSEPEILLSTIVGQKFSGLKIDGRIERFETSQRISLCLPSLRVSLVDAQDSEPAPIGIERDASCSEHEVNRRTVEFDSANR